MSLSTKRGLSAMLVAVWLPVMTIAAFAVASRNLCRGASL